MGNHPPCLPGSTPLGHYHPILLCIQGVDKTIILCVQCKLFFTSTIFQNLSTIVINAEVSSLLCIFDDLGPSISKAATVVLSKMRRANFTLCRSIAFWNSDFHVSKYYPSVCFFSVLYKVIRLKGRMFQG